MGYLEDLKDNMALAIETLSELEKCHYKGWGTAVEALKLQLDCTLNSIRFCISCVKRKAEKLNIPECDVCCTGGCVKRRPLGMTLGGSDERDR